MIERNRDSEGGGVSRMLRTLLVMTGVFFTMLLFTGMSASWLGTHFEAGSRACYLMQAAVQAVLAFIGTALITARLTARSPLRFLALVQPVGWRPFLGVVIVFALCMPFLNQLIYWNASMEFHGWFSAMYDYMKHMEEINGKVTEVILGTSSVGGLLAGVAVVGVLTGFAEEIFFRGTLQRALGQDRHMGQWAVWITAIIFSAVHLQFFGFFPRLLLGAFFGYLLYSTGSLWPGAFAHALNNSIVVVSYWARMRGSTLPSADTWGVAETGFPWMAAASLAATILFLATCRRYFFAGKPAAA